MTPDRSTTSRGSAQHASQPPTIAAGVAARTLAAAHRRDHEHPFPTHDCRPHAVEVVYLGVRAATVCHDCHSDGGFVPHREAEQVARLHRHHTGTLAVTASGQAG